MALVSLRELLDHAAVEGYGIPAFNVNNLEQIQAVMEAAKEVGAPVILQALRFEFIYANVGLHPHEAKTPVSESVFEELAQLAQLEPSVFQGLNGPKSVAVGNDPFSRP